MCVCVCVCACGGARARACVCVCVCVCVSRDRTSVGHGDDGLDAITSNQRINTTLCKIKTSMYLKSSKKKKL